MVLTSNGEVLTNNHVIDGATSISVTDVGNGKTYQAHVVGYDRTGDVAVVQLSTCHSVCRRSPRSSAHPGGGPGRGGGGQRRWRGRYSECRRRLGHCSWPNPSLPVMQGGGNAENLNGLIEINAGIQPGDSGGSLVNTEARSSGWTPRPSADSNYQASSQAYAIPIQTALSVAHKIVAGQASSVIHIGPTGFLGLGISDSSGRNTGTAAATASAAVRRGGRRLRLVGSRGVPGGVGLGCRTGRRGGRRHDREPERLVGQLALRPQQPAGAAAPWRLGAAPVDRPVRPDPHRLGHARLGPTDLTPAPAAGEDSLELAGLISARPAGWARPRRGRWCLVNGQELSTSFSLFS